MTSQSTIQNPRSTILSCTDLRKTYRMGKVDVPVLRGVSLDVRKGEWVAILGASGCGKSTLLHLLGDLDRPDKKSGALMFDGRTLEALSLHERNLYRNQTVGFVFQFYHLLPELNVTENTMLHAMVKPSLRGMGYWLAVALIGGVVGGIIGLALVRGFDLVTLDMWWEWLAAGAIGALVGAAIAPPLLTELQSISLRFSPKRAAMVDRATTLLQSFGLGHRLKHRPRELSGGERQRVAIARALMNQPAVLLADEPTGNLDEKTGGEILDLIAEQHRQGLTIVMVTHDESIAKRADRVVRLHDGRVA